MASYIHALTLHMRLLSPHMEDICVDTVYIGGGTPGILPPDLLGKLLTAMQSCFWIAPSAEISMETNPIMAAERTNAASLLSIARKGGVNRLSVGLQSVHDSELEALGRLHRYAEFAETIRLARSLGFENLSADLMYGIPKQTLDSLQSSLDRLIDEQPTHISLYGLRVEPHTPFGRMGKDLILPDEDIQCELYEMAVERLAKSGYARYEISNFAKEGYACRHNLRYWQREEYIGLGAAAHSFYDGVRYSYPASVKSYIDPLTEGKLPPYDTFDCLTEADAANERIMLGLRLERGVEATERLCAACACYLRGGFMWQKDGRIGFTTKGFLVSNEILSELIE